MSHVHYKFKSSVDHDTVTFDGLSISLGDLKKAIMTRSKLPKSSDFDLQVVNAQTNEVYKSDTDLIGRNTSVIVTRVPVGACSGAGDEGVSAGAGAKGREIAKATMDRLNKAADLTKAQGSEEEKIMAMMNQAAKDYSEANYVVKTRAPPGQPPVTYVCYRCGIKGHWIQNCPMQFQQKPDAMAFPGMLRGVKKTHGIPQSFLLPATKDTPGAMLTAIGTYAVPKMDAEAYARGKKEKPAFTENNDPALINPEKKIPKELLCTLCNELLRDATIVPCCGVSFCDECVRDSLVEGDDEQECPSCKEVIVPDQLIPNKFLRSAVTNFLSESNVLPRMHSAPVATAAMAAPVIKQQPQPASSNSPAYGTAVKAEPCPAPVMQAVRPATPVVDEKPEVVSSDQPAAAATAVGQSSSGTSAGSSASSTENAQGQVVAVIGRKYATGGPEGPALRLSGTRGQLASRGSRQLGHASNSVHPPHAAILHGAPVMHGHLPYGVPRFRPMPPPMAAAAPPMAVGFGPRPAPFPMYPSAAMPPVMYMPAAPQHMPGGPVLTAEEFYKEKARLLEEELQKQKKSDPLDDFARELLDYKKEQRKRQRSRSSTRSRSRSRKRSDSRSPKRRYRSRSRSRSRSPYYKRSPGFYRRSSRSPYQRRSPSSAITPSPPLDFARGRRSSSPHSRHHRSSPSRDKYMDEYYRRYLEDYFSRVDPHYDPRYFEEYYRNFYERYARGSPLSDAYGVPSRAVPYLSGYPPVPHHDGERGAFDFRHDSDVHQRHDDVSSRYRGRNPGTRGRNEDRLRLQPSGSRRRSRDRGPSTEKHPSRDSEVGKSGKDGVKEKRTGHRDKKKRDDRSGEKAGDVQAQEKTMIDTSSVGTTDKAACTTTATLDESRSKQKKVDGKRKKDTSGDQELSSGEDSQKRKRRSKREKSERRDPGDGSVSAAAASVECVAPAEVDDQVSSSNIELPVADKNDKDNLVVLRTDVQPLPQEKEHASAANSEHPAKESAQSNVEPQVAGSIPVSVAQQEEPLMKEDSKRKRPRSPSGVSNKIKLKKKHKVAVAATSALPSEHSPNVPVATVSEDGQEDKVQSEKSGAATASSASSVLIKPPELSRWERDDHDSPERDVSPQPKKPVEKVKPQSLPKSVIESAEKALMSKQPKPLIASTISTLSTSSTANSTRPIGGATISSMGATSRKVLVGPNKESAAATAVAHEGGVAADRKVQSVASSVRITISQDKGFTEDDGCKDLREKISKGKDNVPDTKEIRKTGAEKESKSEMGLHSRHSEDYKRRESKSDRRDDTETEHCFGKDSDDKGSMRDQNSKKKSSRDPVASKIGEAHVSKGHRERHDVDRPRDTTNSASRPESTKGVVSVKESEIAIDAKHAKADSGKHQAASSSQRNRKEGHDADGSTTVTKCERDDTDELKFKGGSSDSKQSKAVESGTAPTELAPAQAAGLRKELTSVPSEAAAGSIPLSKSQTVTNGPVDKADTVASEPSSIRLSDEASFNPDYDETSTQSSGGSESAHSDDDDGPAALDSTSRDKEGRTEAADGGAPAKQRSSDSRAKSSRSKHKKHKKHTKKHKKHKKHKKSSSTKVN